VKNAAGQSSKSGFEINGIACSKGYIKKSPAVGRAMKDYFAGVGAIAKRERVKN